MGSKGDYYVFALGAKEKELLIDLLNLFPSAHPRKSKLVRSNEVQASEAQKLLEESLAAQKRENQKRLISLLARKERLVATDSGFEWSLHRPEIEWLLQILNDIRVGAWIALGSPDLEQRRALQVDVENASWAWAMDLAGFFEMSLLSAINPPG